LPHRLVLPRLTMFWNYTASAVPASRAFPQISL
jgi:hypothetical protein